MSVDSPDKMDARTAGEDLTDKLYYALHMETDGTLELAVAGEVVWGTCYEECESGGKTSAAIAGFVKGVAGGAIDPGTEVTSDANGKFVAASAGDKYFGFYRGDAAAADGDVICIFVDRGTLET